MSLDKLNHNVNNNDLDDNDVIHANEDHINHYAHNDYDIHDDVDVKDDDIGVMDDKGDAENVDDDNGDDDIDDKSLHLFKVLQEMPSYHEYNDYNNHLNQNEARSSSSSSSCNLSIYNRNRNKIVWSMDRIRQIYKDHLLWPNFIGTKKIIFNEGDNIT